MLRVFFLVIDDLKSGFLIFKNGLAKPSGFLKGFIL